MLFSFHRHQHSAHPGAVLIPLTTETDMHEAPKPLYTHPTPQGLGERKDRDTIFFLAGWNGCNEGLDANEQFKKATIAAQAKQGERKP